MLNLIVTPGTAATLIILLNMKKFRQFLTLSLTLGPEAEFGP